MKASPLTVHESLPMVCTIDVVCRALDISRAQFFALRKAGKFPIPELLPKIDHRPRFSGAAIQAYLEQSQRRTA